MDFINLMSFNGPNEVQNSGSIIRHELFVKSCILLDLYSSCLIDGLEEKHLFSSFF